MMDHEGFLRFNKSGLLEAGYDDNSPPQCYYQVQISFTLVSFNILDIFFIGIIQYASFLKAYLKTKQYSLYEL